MLAIKGYVVIMNIKKLFVKNDEFLVGFLDGLGAPALFFKPMLFRRTKSYNTSLSNNWKQVGNALRVSLETEKENIANTTQENITQK